MGIIRPTTTSIDDDQLMSLAASPTPTAMAMPTGTMDEPMDGGPSSLSPSHAVISMALAVAAAASAHGAMAASPTSSPPSHQQLSSRQRGVAHHRRRRISKTTTPSIMLDRDADEAAEATDESVPSSALRRRKLVQVLSRIQRQPHDAVALFVPDDTLSHSQHHRPLLRRRTLEHQAVDDDARHHQRRRRGGGNGAGGYPWRRMCVEQLYRYEEQA